MKLIDNKEMFECKFGKKDNRTLLKFCCGDLVVFYSFIDKTYIVKRKDDKCFDGTESLDIQVYGNMKLPSTTEEKLEYCLDNFTMLQKDDASMFKDFDYKINDTNDRIIIYPVYLNDVSVCSMEFETKIDKNLGEVNVLFGTRKKCRKLIK